MTNPAPSRVRLISSLAVAVLAISSAALLIRLSHAPPVTIAFYRLAYATLLVAPVAWFRARAELRALTARDALTLMATGAVLALHFASWFASISTTTPYATSVAASAVLVTLHPILVAIATPIFLRERVPQGAWTGIGLALAGGAVIALGDAGSGKHRLIGDLLAFTGAVAGAIYLLVGRTMRGRLSLLAYVTPVYASAAVTLAILALLGGDPILITSPREHGLFIALAVGPMILGHTVFNWALAHVPAWVVSTTILAEPVASTLLVMAVLGEAPGSKTMLGGALVLAGVFAVSMPRRDRSEGRAAPRSES